MLFLSACGATVASPSQTAVPPAAGTYSGNMEDGSTLRVVLVLNDNQIQVQEVGYFFAPTGIEVKRVFLDGNKSFGEVLDNTLTFQLPVMMGFFGPIQYYNVELKWDKPGELHCTLAVADPKEEPLKFQMENLSIDATRIPAGASMKDNYELILRP
jgi:hypothetical protein